MRSLTNRFFSRSVLAAAIAGIGTPASAAFFQLAENSASGMGNAFAGGAAIAEDASTVWYNPAGMTRLKGPQFVFAGHFIDPSFKATVNSATTTDFTGIGGPPSVPISGGGGEAGESALVPNFYYTQAIASDYSIGVGVNAPFGLATEYDNSWAGRYHAVRSEIRTYNINVAGAYKFSDVASAGVGINYQHLSAELTQAIDFATLCTLAGQSGTCGFGAGFNPGTNPNDGDGKVTADSNAWGYNFGLLAQLPSDLRLGLAYRSKVKHKLSGDFDATVPTASPVTAVVASGFGIVNSTLKADVTLPATLSLSLYQQLGSQWALMADVTRTDWSSLQELRIKFDSTQGDSVVTLNLKNVYRYSVGATYKPGGAWVFRGGIALDQSPVSSEADATPRLPDGDRTWLSIGAGLQASPTLSFDLGYTYIKVDDPKVRKIGAPGNENQARGNLSADYTGSVQVLSAQARWTF